MGLSFLIINAKRLGGSYEEVDETRVAVRVKPLSLKERGDQYLSSLVSPLLASFS